MTILVTGRFLFLKLPLLAAHGTQMGRCLGAQPLHNAMDVEMVGALTPHKRTVVPGDLAIRTAG